MAKTVGKDGVMGNSIQLTDLLQVVFKRMRVLIMIPVFCAIIGLLVSLYALTPIYRVQVDLLVNQTSQADNELPAATDVEMSLRLIETYQFIINSSRVRDIVLEQLNHEYSVKQMKKKLTVQTNPDTQIISLYVEDNDPEVASKIANLYAVTSQQEISNLMQMDNVRILTEAKAENYPAPVRPAPVLYTIISLFAGTVLALLYIALSAYFNITIHTRKDVEKYLEVPLLGSVSMFSQKGRRKKKRWEKQGDFVQLISRVKASKLDMEAFRALRTNIQFQRVAKNLQSILVTSTGKSEGKTVTAGNLAMAMAMDNKKTILIDADLRKVTGTDAEENSEDIGLTNYLSGFAAADQIVRETSITNLYMIGSGPIPPNPTELLASLRMDSLLSELEAEYDMIIIDSSSMLYADPAILAAKVDGCVFISHAGKTKVNDAQQAIEQLKTVHATILGAVLNNKKERKRAASY